MAHGDVKPANIVVTPEGATVLVDLGLVQLADAAGPSGHSAPYAAPELRVPGALSTPEADQFAFAVTTAQVLTGQPPPTGPDGWLDTDALGRLLASSPVTVRRPMLVRRIMSTLLTPPEARPRELGTWLDSAAETLSQVTATGPQVTATGEQAPVGATVPSMPATGLGAAGPPPSAPPGRRRRGRILIAAGVAVVLLGIGTAVIVTHASAQPPGMSIPSPTSAAVAAQPSATTATANDLGSSDINQHVVDAVADHNRRRVGRPRPDVHRVPEPARDGRHGSGRLQRGRDVGRLRDRRHGVRPVDPSRNRLLRP